MVRVLVVDDSSFMRKSLTQMLTSDSSIEVIDTASEGEETIRKVKQLHPDVVLLDVAMPVMDGLTALAHIMYGQPTPVVVLSGIKDAKIAIKALELGAVDFMKKPSGVISYDIEKIKDEIICKVKTAAGVDVTKIFTYFSPVLSLPPLSFPWESGERKGAKEIIVIGASTGGPRAVVNILSGLPQDIPAGVLIVQHMTSEFIPSFVDRLQWVSSLDISIASEGDVIMPGKVLVSDGGCNTTIVRDKKNRLIHLDKRPSSHVIMPSVDFAMETAADAYREKALGVLLTGMGHDGVNGMKTIKEAGGCTIAEDETTCVVFGMPKAAIEAGVVDEVVPLSKIAETILRRV